MSIVLELQPLIPARQPYGLDIKPHANALLSGRRDFLPFISQAFERIQNSVNYLETAVRNFNPGEFDEIIVKDPNGDLIGWIGSRPPYFGAWFKQLYVGGDGPDTAPLFADEDGNVIIGVNGSVAIQDSGGNEFGWLGVEADAPKNITGATNTTPIQITCNAHGYENGDTVLIQNVGGNTAANGYRIVKNAAANTFDITDLDGVNVAGSGAYTAGGTTTRYFGGGRFQTLAVGDSFTDYKLRAYANGDLKIFDALIRLEDPVDGSYIELNPTGPLATFRGDNISLLRTRIEDGTIILDQEGTPNYDTTISATSISMRTTTGDPSILIQTAGGVSGSIGVYNNVGVQTVSLSGLLGTVTALGGTFDDVDVLNVLNSANYEISGVPGISDAQTLVTNVSVNTSSAITSVNFGANSTTSGSFVTSITLSTVSMGWTGGLLTSSV